MKSNHWFFFIFLPALCMVDKLQSFHKGIRSTLFCAGWDNGATPIVWDSLPSWTMFRGAITPSPMATAQQPKNGVNSTSAMATPVFVKERQRGRDVWEKKHVCVCLQPSKAAMSCADQAVHAASSHSQGLTVGIQPPGVSSMSIYPPMAPSIQPTLHSSLHSTDHRSYTSKHAGNTAWQHTKILHQNSLSLTLKWECSQMKRRGGGLW